MDKTRIEGCGKETPVMEEERTWSTYSLSVRKGKVNWEDSDPFRCGDEYDTPSEIQLCTECAQQLGYKW